MTVQLFHGDDESILRSTVADAVRHLVGDQDRSLVVAEFDGEDYGLAEVVDAIQTPPMFTDRRVVVARGLSRFGAAELAPLAAALSEPLESTDVVVEWGSGRVTKALADAVKAGGGTQTSTTVSNRAGDRRSWVAERAAAAGVELQPGAVALLVERLGEDMGRLDGIVTTLASTYAGGALAADEVAPFVGDGGDLPPWSLTDAIDAGKTAEALNVLARMTQAGARHPLAVMVTLHNHYARLARLDGAGARNADEAAEALGIKPGFPARKAWDQYRALGGDDVRRAMQILADADADLRGRRDLPDDVTMEIAVARLSRLRRRSTR